MPTTVKLEYPPGNLISTRQFNPGDPLHIAVNCRGTVIGLPTPNVKVTLSISDTNFAPIYAEGLTNLAGNVDFDVVLPVVVAQATIQIIAIYPIQIFIGPEIVSIPIGIGTIPEPLPGPPTNTWDQVFKVLPWILVVFGVIYLNRSLPAAKSRKQ